MPRESLINISYCQATSKMEANSVHVHYHNHVYGFPVSDDSELFCRLTLEVNQAGLSWEIILKKEKNFRKAFSNFKVNLVAEYNENDISRLLKNEKIIRNRKKIEATIENAKTILKMQKGDESFYRWLLSHHPLLLSDWVKLFRKNFRFTGKEVTKEFLMSIGFLEGAHEKDCPIYPKIKKKDPPWLNSPHLNLR